MARKWIPSQVREISYDAAKNIFIGNFVMFLSGSMFALGVFNSAVEQAADPPGSLDAVWSSSMAVMSFSATISMLVSGVLISDAKSESSSSSFFSSRTSRIRLLSLLSTLSYALLCLGGPIVASRSKIAIKALFGGVGIGFGIFYFISLELLAEWSPNNAGLSVGVGQMGFGLGTIIFSYVFNMLISMFSLENAFYVSGSLISVPLIALCFQMKWPPQCALPLSNSTDEEMSLISNRSEQEARLSIGNLPLLPGFWLYMICISCAQASFSLIPYYFKVAHAFHESTGLAVHSFQACMLIGTLVRPFVGIMCSNVKTKRGYFCIGSKNVTLILLAVQMVQFLLLIPISDKNWNIGFEVTSCILLAMLSTGACCGPLLAREVFGSENSALVFGVAGSLAMGSGECIAVLMMSALHDKTSSEAIGYNRFYVFGSVWSGCGLIACAFLQKQRRVMMEEKV